MPGKLQTLGFRSEFGHARFGTDQGSKAWSRGSANHLHSITLLAPNCQARRLSIGVSFGSLSLPPPTDVDVSGQALPSGFLLPGSNTIKSAIFCRDRGRCYSSERPAQSATAPPSHIPPRCTQLIKGDSCMAMARSNSPFPASSGQGNMFRIFSSREYITPSQLCLELLIAHFVRSHV